MDLINQNVCLRSSGSGCWYGELLSWDPATRVVTLANARHLHRWWADEGASLAGVAKSGIKPDREGECRIDSPVAVAVVADVLEILATTRAAQTSIERQVARQS